MRSVILAVLFVVFTRAAVCVVITNLKDYCEEVDKFTCVCEGLNFGNFDDVEIDISTKFDCEYFYFRNSNFSTIPRNAFRISKPVKWFHMTNCSLKYIHKWNFYSGQSNPKTFGLDLHDNQIEKIPSEVFEYIPNLRLLQLSNNKLSILEIYCFKGLKKLWLLNLSNNRIETLRKDIFNELTELESISLSDNRLQVLPGNIFKNNGQLKLINLCDNHLKIIDTNAVSSSAALQFMLQFMLVHFNESFQITPVSILNIPSAEKVFVDGNYFPYISRTSFSKTTKLERLSSSGVNLNYIEDGAFSHMSDLTHLNLADNLLETFDFDLVSNLKRLKYLYINKNRLKVIDYRSNYKPNVTFLALKDNLLSCDHRENLRQYLKEADVSSDLEEQSCLDITSTPKNEEYTETTPPIETSSDHAVISSEKTDSTTDLSFEADLRRHCMQNQSDQSLLTISVITNLIAVLIILFGLVYLLLRKRSYAEETDIAVRLVETKS